jgi:hypothetical protein
MSQQRFSAQVTPGPRSRGVIAVPFDPDAAWGAKAEHPVGGTIDGQRVRGTLAPGEGGWAFTVSQLWMRDAGVEAGTDVTVELSPEGPQRQDLAADLAAALEASPAATSTPRPAVPSCVRRGSPRSWTCSRPGSSNGPGPRKGPASPRR